FSVPDASIDVWKLAWAVAHSAEAHGARILPYHRVIDLLREGDRVVGAQLRDERRGTDLELRARVTLNAAGAWAGQLAALAACAVTDTHHITRTFTLLDHRARDGVEGFLTITGGKLTTFRLMAKLAVDAICERLGVSAECRTDAEALPGSEQQELYRLGDRLR